MARLLFETALILFCFGSCMKAIQGVKNSNSVERPFQSLGSVISDNGKAIHNQHPSKANPVIPAVLQKISSGHSKVPGQTPLEFYMPASTPRLKAPTQIPSRTNLNNLMNNIPKIPTANIVQRPSALKLTRAPSNLARVPSTTPFDYYLPSPTIPSRTPTKTQTPSKAHLNNPVNNFRKIPTVNVAYGPAQQSIRPQVPKNTFTPVAPNNANVKSAMAVNALLNQNFQRIPSQRIPNVAAAPQLPVYSQPMINNFPAAVYRPQVMSFRPLLPSPQKSYSSFVYNQTPYRKFSPVSGYQNQPMNSAYFPPVQKQETNSNNFALAGEAPYPEVAQEDQNQNALVIDARKSQVSKKKSTKINSSAQEQTPQEEQVLEQVNKSGSASLQPVEQQIFQNQNFQPPLPTQQTEAYAAVVNDQSQLPPVSHLYQQNVENINQYANHENTLENFPKNEVNTAQQHMNVLPLGPNNERPEPIHSENFPAYQAPAAVAY